MICPACKKESERITIKGIKLRHCKKCINKIKFVKSFAHSKKIVKIITNIKYLHYAKN